jgi:predicted lipoprotein with Yx(FWY)xxD motif
MPVNGTLLSVAAATTLLLSGCVASSDPSATPTPAPSRVRVSGLFAVTTRTEGEVVIDGRGYVVYRSDNDSPAPARSACTGPCADLWPPVPWTADLRLEGINRELVGAYRRPDGQLQLTLGGWPLYEYTGDRTPGETNGRGVDGKWWLARPNRAL